MHGVILLRLIELIFKWIELKTPQKIKSKKKTTILPESTIRSFTADSAYSTVFDALILLVLISLSGVLLMPYMQAEKQYNAAYDVSSSDLNSHVLESLLSCKLEDFEYENSPIFALNMSVPENSVVEDPSRVLFQKEQKHKTFADLVTEYLALALTLPDPQSVSSLNQNMSSGLNLNSNNSTDKYRDFDSSNNNNKNKNNYSYALNPFAADYVSEYSKIISAYINQKGAGRFSYRFEAYWQPVEAFPMKSELIIGDEPPAYAFRQSTKLSMPSYVNTPSKEPLLACVNDSMLETTSLASSDKKAARILGQAFDDCLDAAAEKGSEELIGLLFTQDYAGSVLEEGTEESFYTLLYGVSDNSDQRGSASLQKEFDTYFTDRLQSGVPLNTDISSENVKGQEIKAAEEGKDNSLVLREELRIYFKEEIKKELETEFSDDIDRTISSIIKAKNLSEARTLRDACIDSIYKEINPGGARIVLSIWDSHS